MKPTTRKLMDVFKARRKAFVQHSERRGNVHRKKEAEHNKWSRNVEGSTRFRKNLIGQHKHLPKNGKNRGSI